MPRTLARITQDAAPLRPERIRVKRAAEIMGETVRTVQALAARGAIPGAAKPARNWTFDERKLRSWLASKEAECARAANIRPVHTGAAIRYGAKSKSRGVSIGKPLEQIIQDLQRSVSRSSMKS